MACVDLRGRERGSTGGDLGDIPRSAPLRPVRLRQRPCSKQGINSIADPPSKVAIDWFGTTGELNSVSILNLAFGLTVTRIVTYLAGGSMQIRSRTELDDGLEPFRRRHCR
jgi:hypothetical protein